MQPHAPLFDQTATIHELRNVLSAIATGFHLLENRPREARASSIWKGMREAAAVSQQLASQLLAEQEAHARTVIDLREALDHLSTRVRPFLPDNISLSIRTWQGVPPILAAPEECEAVLLHLVDNAIEAMPDGGTLTIDARPSRGDALIAVADDGIGMRRQGREQAMCPFYTTRPERDIGLGLMQAKRFTAQLGGRFSFRSTPARGSVFVLRLPGAPRKAD
ncbi:sensor histidine kinase [Novosphingobium mangrovi (ex Huang et al. 2023)]|uniref:histidine kinase n=1 Tax=Novosphingobium mangrovi (ex Huang et al. 2023) TaxID=2976432 RepID=A0ABT2I0Y5_9SPHN|nr:HAMP domain-containing sensor histidine kinase [Novosphingobium mangrovi (ex Huang et al. 2023)]MCT2398323.1 HAMP domain-containing histidine kinase [Novosphingobium mangrovi (ex Huang et al. 2023)]